MSTTGHIYLSSSYSLCLNIKYTLNVSLLVFALLSRTVIGSLVVGLVFGLIKTNLERDKCKVEMCNECREVRKKVCIHVGSRREMYQAGVRSRVSFSTLAAMSPITGAVSLEGKIIVT
jgi:hypothetical protein